MVSIPSRSRLLSTAARRDVALKRYGRGANLEAMTGVPSKPPSCNISPMILSEAPLPYISAVSKKVTPSAMLARKALPTSLRPYSLPYPHSLVEPHAQRSDVQLNRQTNCKPALHDVSFRTFVAIPSRSPYAKVQLQYGL